MHDEGRRVTAFVQQAGQAANHLQVVAVLAAARHHAVEFAVADDVLEGADKLGPVLPPALAEGVLLLTGGAAVVHPQHAGRPLRFQMCARRTRHQSQSANVCKP